MNINNIFGGILGFVISMAFLYLFWTPIDGFLTGIGQDNVEVKVFLQVSFVIFAFILGFLAPINLATADDKGEN